VSRYYGMDGQPITLMEFVRMYETDDARRIGYDIRDGVTVSTVLLGLDHNWGDGPPLIFETMIFGGEHDEFQERYSTREEAEEGHRRACELAFGVTA
jgi:hypothetical protein